MKKDSTGAHHAVETTHPTLPAIGSVAVPDLQESQPTLPAVEQVATPREAVCEDAVVTMDLPVFGEWDDWFVEEVVWGVPFEDANAFHCLDTGHFRVVDGCTGCFAEQTGSGVWGNHQPARVR